MQEEQDLREKLTKRYQAMEIIEKYASEEITIKDISKFNCSTLTEQGKLKELFSDLEKLFGTAIAEDKKNILTHFYAEKAMYQYGGFFRDSPFGRFGGITGGLQGIIFYPENPFEQIREDKEKERVAIESLKRQYSMLTYAFGRIALDVLESPDTEITEEKVWKSTKNYERSWDNLQTMREKLNKMHADISCVDVIARKLESLYKTKFNEAAQQLISFAKEELSQCQQTELIDALKFLMGKVNERKREWNAIVLMILCDVLMFHLETNQQTDIQILKSITVHYAASKVQQAMEGKTLQ